ncbi:pyridoxal phosphate-dependent transferase [Melampsora americana]|nr:pyridoxal phosphate-dependent transferase [Melampsora americana]
MGFNNEPQARLGSSVPPDTPHAVSVSLPTWQDNIDYELGLDRVINNLLTGYPRFFIHLDIKKLAEVCHSKHAITAGEQCMLFPSHKSATLCLEFLTAKITDPLDAPDHSSLSEVGRIVKFSSESQAEPVTSTNGTSNLPLVVYALFVPNRDIFRLARTFWQHTGLGISSRLAERFLRLLGLCPVRAESSKAADELLSKSPITPSPPRRGPLNGSRRHYAVKSSVSPPPICSGPTESLSEPLEDSIGIYLEERYGRNLPIEQAQLAKLALKRRIAGVLTDEDDSKSDVRPNESIKPSERGLGRLSESDVYLFPTGMSSIFCAHQLCMATRSSDAIDFRLRPSQSVCFGFPYTDTLKILQKWGPGAHFFGHGEEDDLERLEALLVQDRKDNLPPVTALFCEFPSNPLLKAADLKRIRQLATEYGFLVVIDETIGNFVNVEVLPYADIIVSSLTKLFSGDSNVMGGSLVLNPSSDHYSKLKELLDSGCESNRGQALYEDVYFHEDAIYMERNSRDFRSRVHRINHNASALCSFLTQQMKSSSSKVIKMIYYPQYMTTANFEACKRPSGGYGGLFSITFTSALASRVFYDNLGVYKGPSLGTNFTLASPYVILAHFTELDWAEGFGVDQNLIRISVGLEDSEVLIKRFDNALKATIAAVQTEGDTNQSTVIVQVP